MSKGITSVVRALLAFSLLSAGFAAPQSEAEIVVYGGTAAGVMAAVQAARMGRKVILISPGSRLGGLSSGGLGQTDIGDKGAIGGLARRFYERIALHYSRPEAWVWQSRERYRDGGQTRTEDGETAMWTFEPHVAEAIFESYVRENGIVVLRRERLELKGGVRKEASRIVEIRLESGRIVRASIFIDATYEGDLMAKAGVSYRVGREASSEYRETLNGVQTAQAKYHQFRPGVDPYIIRGDRKSGLLPGIDATGPGVDGTGDRRVQAYNLRACFTDHPDNRIAFAKPDGYDERDYELLFRNYEAGYDRVPWINASMPNCKTDANNRDGFSSDLIGGNYRYPDADYAGREQIYRRHLKHQQGLMWTLANHPRIPDKIRAAVSDWGVTKDEFRENGGWPEQLYVREARRMEAAYIMTQHHCEGNAVAEIPMGLAAYGMDSHHTQRYVDRNGHVQNEGDVEVRVAGPYPIDFRACVPREEQCSNLIVPVCLSATHIAYGSIRMEPVFMVLGQSAATAAVHALQEGVGVQQIDRARLVARLQVDGQILEWKTKRVDRR